MLDLREQVHSSEQYLASEKIRIYNTLTGTKAEFIPIDCRSIPPKVKMYVCGLTPWDHPHLGHACAAVRFDVIRNYLEYRNLDVVFQTNVTDIDDKIIKRSVDTGEDARGIAIRFNAEFERGAAALGIRQPTHLTKVSECLSEIKEFVAELVEMGMAYATSEGNVYFDISKKEDYGKLSGQRIQDLISGTRDREPDPMKKNPLDFALWKRDDSSLSTESPWGLGRPGWHIECSAMIHYTLGAHIDIHGGGVDIKFPHHENEIAQSEGHHGNFVNFWMHSGLLTVENQKMSKSLGNYFTIDQALERFGPELIRFVMLRSHYRSELGFSDQVFRENLNALIDFHKTLAKVATIDPALCGTTDATRELMIRFEGSMNNDFSTPEALVALQEALQNLRGLLASGNVSESNALGSTIMGLGNILGIFKHPPAEVYAQCLKFSCLSKNAEVKTIADIETLIGDRQAARAAKDFAKSDQIRAELAQYGLEVLDVKNGAPEWRFTV